ncbi:von Willebrand factor A domain-containing protein 2 [Biomphalaria glabrata]|nr:von Willebrand factor A domain-containing protein 2 [Biomphalaria glabrata]
MCTVSWITCSLLDARSVKNIQVERNVATDMCPAPKAPLNGQVDCEYSDALQIEIFCRVSCKTGYMFDKTDAQDFMFPCDVATGFFDTVITPDCIPIHESTLVPPLGLLMICSFSNARSVKNMSTTRNVETDMCPTPTAPPNGYVNCQYSDALQIEIDAKINLSTTIGLKHTLHIQETLNKV